MSLDADAMVDRRRLKRRLAFWRVAAALLAAAAIAAVWFQTRPGEYAVGRLEISGFIVEDAERDRLLRRPAGLEQDSRREHRAVGVWRRRR